MKKTPIKVAIGATTALIASTAAAGDFGQKTQDLARSMASRLFGVQGVLDASSSASLTSAEANANPAALATVALGATTICGIAWTMARAKTTSRTPACA